MKYSASYYEAINAAIQFREEEQGEPFTANFGDFCLQSAYQPIVSLVHQRVVGYEALIRPSINGKGVSPEWLFAKTREEGFSASLDRLCRTVHIANFKQPEQPAWLFMNVDTQTISDEIMPVEFITQALQKAGLTPAQIVLEIVENKVVDDKLLIDFVERYKAAGFHIAIDDFGKGESNFDRIWKLAPHIVKLDREMLQRAVTDTRAQGLLNGLVSLLRQCGCLVLVEGVETEAQAMVALNAGADMFQGYYFGRPVHHLVAEAALDNILSTTMRHFRQSQFQKEEKCHQVLTHLRLEILGVCDQLSRGVNLDEACVDLLLAPAVKRCFVLNRFGSQTGKTVGKLKPVVGSGYNPLSEAEGANWAHRDYFKAAFERPNQIMISKPYIALPDVEPTVTFSIYTYTQTGHCVFCVDCNPEELEQDYYAMSGVMGIS